MKVRQTFVQIKFIQYKFRIVLLKLRERVDVLRLQILPKKITEFSNLLQTARSKALQAARLELSDLGQAKIDWVANALLHLAKFDFRAQFLAWYLKNKVDEVADPGKARAIQAGIDQAYTMTDHLIDFISMDGNEALLGSLEAQRSVKKRRTIMLNAASLQAAAQLEAKRKALADAEKQKKHNVASPTSSIKSIHSKATTDAADHGLKAPEQTTEAKESQKELEIGIKTLEADLSHKKLK
jgi:hypothetical protein